MSCPVTACEGYNVLKLDEDDNNHKATMIIAINHLQRILYDHNKVVMDFHTEDGDNRTNYVIIPDSGVLAVLNLNDEDKFIFGDK